MPGNKSGGYSRRLNIGETGTWLSRRAKIPALLREEAYQTLQSQSKRNPPRGFEQEFWCHRPYQPRRRLSIFWSKLVKLITIEAVEMQIAPENSFHAMENILLSTWEFS
jgi:hypothetical protein